MKLSPLLLLSTLAPAPLSAHTACGDYGNTVICAGDQCYKCHEDFCSGDDQHPNPPNCGTDIEEPTLAHACSEGLHLCVVDAAAACNSNPNCNSFSLDPQSWSGGGKAKLFHNNGNGMVANTDWNTWVKTNETAPPSPSPAPPGGCKTNLDCSLNGVCGSDKKCTCDKPWKGDNCELVGFKPVTFPQGYGMEPNITTWGGNAIYDGKKYHMFVSRMTNECLLETWTHNSRIDHAVSDTVEGPYTFSDVAVNTWAHNAAPLALKDGTFAIIHIGTGTGGPNGGQNCTPSSFDEQNHRDLDFEARLAADAAEAASTSGGSTIHVSKSLNGPWTPLTTTLGNCNNPAPWVHPNGTIYVYCGSSLYRTENLAGPFIQVPTTRDGNRPNGNYEDPQIYTDRRGNFHAFFHVYQTQFPGDYCVNSTVSAHMYSADGHAWHFSPTPPYDTQVLLSTGETVTVATRERPKPFFQNGIMTHLFNGVCGSPYCSDSTSGGCVNCKYEQWDYTLAAPLDV